MNKKKTSLFMMKYNIYLEKQILKIKLKANDFQRILLVSLVGSILLILTDEYFNIWYEVFP